MLSDDTDHARQYAEHLRQGHFILGVSVGEDEAAKQRAADALRAVHPLLRRKLRQGSRRQRLTVASALTRRPRPPHPHVVMTFSTNLSISRICQLQDDTTWFIRRKG